MGKKKKHDEAHGGAWKVAYADFVTAMMALFMVLWISAQDDEILVATTEYFNSPFTSPMPASSGVMQGKQESINYDEKDGRSHAFTPDMYKKLAEEFLKLLDISDDDKEKDTKPVDIKVTRDGIIMTVFNRNQQPIFDGTNIALTPWGDFVSQNLAWVIDRFHMMVRVDGFIPTGFITEDSNFDEWSLSTEQANLFRRSLVSYGLSASKIDRVAGFGDNTPIPGKVPSNPANHRVELMLTATKETPTSF